MLVRSSEHRNPAVLSTPSLHRDWWRPAGNLPPRPSSAQKLRSVTPSSSVPYENNDAAVASSAQVDAFELACHASQASCDEAHRALTEQLLLLDRLFPGTAQARQRASVRALLIGTTKAITGMHNTSKELSTAAVAMRDAFHREHAQLRYQRRYLQTMTATLTRDLSDAEVQHAAALQQAEGKHAADEVEHEQAQEAAKRLLQQAKALHMADVQAAEAREETAKAKLQAEQESSLRLTEQKAVLAEQLDVVRGKLARCEGSLARAFDERQDDQERLHKLSNACKATEERLVVKQRSCVEAQAQAEEQRRRREALRQEKDSMAREATEAQAALELALERATEGATQVHASMSAKMAKMSKLQMLALGMARPEGSSPSTQRHSSLRRTSSSTPEQQSRRPSVGTRRAQDAGRSEGYHKQELQKAKVKRGRALLYWELTQAKGSDILAMGKHQAGGGT